MQNNMLSKILAAIAAFILAINTATASFIDDLLDPDNIYFGVEGQLNTIIFKQGYGNRAFDSLNPQAKLIAGINFNENISLEMGYARIDQQYKTLTVTEGQEFLGEEVLFDSEEHTLSFWSQSANITAIYSKYFFKNKIKLSGGIGAYFLWPEILHTRDSITVMPGFTTYSYTNFDFENKNYIVPQALLRASYELFTDCFITASYSLEIYPVMPQIRDEVAGDAYDYKVDFRLGNTMGLGFIYVY